MERMEVLPEWAFPIRRTFFFMIEGGAGEGRGGGQWREVKLGSVGDR